MAEANAGNTECFARSGTGAAAHDGVEREGREAPTGDIKKKQDPNRFNLIDLCRPPLLEQVGCFPFSAEGVGQVVPEGSNHRCLLSVAAG